MSATLALSHQQFGLLLQALASAETEPMTSILPEVASRDAGTVSTDFDAFVRARTPTLLRTAYLLTGDRHLAEDLVQDALARTHRAARRIASNGHFEAYTQTAMYHLQVSRWRRRKVTEALPGELFEAIDPDPDHAAAVSLRVALHQALAQLTKRQRAVLVLRFFEDRSEVDAAEVLGCSVGTVKSQTSRALARLRVLAPGLGLSNETTP